MPLNPENAKIKHPFLGSGGEMGELIRNFDWRRTNLGDPVSWPVILKGLIATMLNTPSPMLICWGEDYIQLYNDAFRPILGYNKHPQALGTVVTETYAEAWETLEPLFQSVMQGEAVIFKDFELLLDRNGYEEKVYFDFSYSAIRDENNLIQGVLVICTETTVKVQTLLELKETNRQLVISKTADFLAMKKAEESEERFRTMADGTDVLIAVADESSSAVYFNRGWVELTGRPMEELLEFGWADLIHPDEKETWLDSYFEAFKERIAFEGEFRILDKAGNYRWLLTKGPPRFHQDGRFAGYISSSVDITERKADEIRKNDFIGMVSHELKTPLTSMKGYVQIILARLKKQNDEFAVATLQKANQQIGKMTAMINGFLNISRLESGKIHIDLQCFDISFLIREAEEESRATISSHVLVFEPVETIFVNADRDKIGQVIHNLISNAVKYSSQGSVINISCVSVGESMRVSVKDEGMGIRAEDIPRLFDRYYRVEGNQMFSISGFGIGLYLCAEIIHRHHGEIWVESEFRKGSAFNFSLARVIP